MLSFAIIALFSKMLTRNRLFFKISFIVSPSCHLKSLTPMCEPPYNVCYYRTTVLCCGESGGAAAVGAAVAFAAGLRITLIALKAHLTALKSLHESRCPVSLPEDAGAVCPSCPVCSILHYIKNSVPFPNKNIQHVTYGSKNDVCLILKHTYIG